jgi:kynurenine formamidase
MRCFDLTMQLDHEEMPDEVFPTATHYYLGPKYHADKGIVVGSETGTCITLPAKFEEFRKTARLHEVPIEKLALRSTAVLDCLCNENGEVSIDEVRKAFENADLKSGDAILVRTGWGDAGMHTQRGDNYILGSPHFSLAAAEALASAMKECKSDLLLTDMGVIGWPGKYMIPEWGTLLPRPNPWPSPEARVYLHLYSSEKAKADYVIENVFARAGIMTVKKLVHCGALKSRKVNVIVAPLHIVRGVASTGRVVAVEGD